MAAKAGRTCSRRRGLRRSDNGIALRQLERLKMGQSGALIASIIAACALGVSLITLWLTYFRRGSVRMTLPSVIYFGPDGSASGGFIDRPKIFLRALLISNSKRGRVVEHLFATLTRGETRQNFNIWVYGDDELKRGSGLFVGETGIATNHHFLLPPDNAEFRFKAGGYQLEVFATLLGGQGAIKLLSQNLTASEAEASSINALTHGLYFDWGPQGNHYQSNLKRHDGPPVFAKVLGAGTV